MFSHLSSIAQYHKTLVSNCGYSCAPTSPSQPYGSTSDFHSRTQHDICQLYTNKCNQTHTTHVRTWKKFFKMRKSRSYRPRCWMSLNTTTLDNTASWKRQYVLEAVTIGTRERAMMGPQWQLRRMSISSVLNMAILGHIWWPQENGGRIGMVTLVLTTIWPLSVGRSELCCPQQSMALPEGWWLEIGILFYWNFC